MGKNKANQTIMNINHTESEQEWAMIEYEMAHSRWENATNLRRNGLAFLTTIQGALITLIGQHILDLNASSYALVFFGIIVTIFSWSHERRVGAYMKGYQKRMLEIENRYNLALLKSGREEVSRTKTFSNRKLFKWYYFVNLLAWLLILAINIFKH